VHIHRCILKRTFLLPHPIDQHHIYAFVVVVVVGRGRERLQGYLNELITKNSKTRIKNEKEGTKKQTNKKQVCTSFFFFFSYPFLLPDAFLTPVALWTNGLTKSNIYMYFFIGIISNFHFQGGDGTRGTISVHTAAWKLIGRSRTFRAEIPRFTFTTAHGRGAKFITTVAASGANISHSKLAIESSLTGVLFETSQS
jgi:hypothetical protein